MRNVLVVGCGLTGSTVVHLLRAASSQLNLQVWDKGSRPGGRCTTFVDKGTGATCDMGCQVVVPQASSELGYPSDAGLHATLTRAALLQPLDTTGATLRGDVLELCGGAGSVAGGGRVLVGSAEAGMTGVTRFLSQGVPVHQSRRLARLDVAPGGGRWSARATGEEAAAGGGEEFDAVVLTMPAPQMLTDVGGAVPALLKETGVDQALSQAQYCSKFAVGLVFPPSSSALASLPWTMLRPQSDPDVGLVSLEHKKRNTAAGSQQQHAVVLVHSTTDFGLRHLGSDKHTISRLLQEGLARVLGQPLLPPPLAVKFNKWRYSQVTRRVPGEHRGAMGLRAGPTGPLLVLAGDSFTASTLDGCVASAKTATDLVLAHLATTQSDQQRP